MKFCFRCLVFLLAVVWVGPAFAERTVEAGKIAAGTEWETEYHVVDSGVSGPTVLIVGGMHGNEPAGWRAAEQIRHWPVVKGKLVVVPRANVKGLAADTRFVPDQTEGQGDLNRNFPQEDDSVAPQGQLATALWKFAAQVKPDWVIDLHEGFEFNLSYNPPDGKKPSVGSSVIYFPSDAMDPLAERVLEAANATVTDEKRRFSLIRRGPVETGLARACIDVLGAEALILETTFKDQPLSLRTRQHRAMVNVLLNHIGSVDRDCRGILTGPKSDGKILVAVFDGPGTGGSKSDLFLIVDRADDMTLHFLGGAEMTPEVLEQFDVVVFPGGSGSKQAAAIGESGRGAVRNFVEAGGGYVGVCAGAYLCSSHYDWSLNLIDSDVFTGSRDIPGEGTKQMWYRGGSVDIDLEITAAGESIFGKLGTSDEVVVRYHNGPIISPKQRPDLDDYRVLAWFRSENGLWEPQVGTMVDTPAIVSGGIGKGRVISVSPHPESTSALHPIIEGAIRWVAQLAAGGEGKAQASKSTEANDLAQRSARSPQEVAEALAEKYGHGMSQVSYIPALALWGRLRLAELSGEPDVLKAVTADVKKIAAAAPVPKDWKSGSVVAGHLIYGALGDRERLLSAAAVGLDADGKPLRPVPGHNEMSDAVFMHCPVLATAYRLSGESVYLDACVAHFEFMKGLCLRDDGLYRHSPLDEAAWGRGNGFPALGVALVISELDGTADAKVRAALTADHVAHLRAMLKYQDADGMWHQVIDHPESYAEFSCTCMIGFALLRGMREGWLDRKEFGQAADLAWSAIKKRIHLDGEFLEGVCTGTGKQTSLQAYFDREEIHGRDDRGGAMALMFSTERMLWERERAAK